MTLKILIALQPLIQVKFEHVRWIQDLGIAVLRWWRPWAIMRSKRNRAAKVIRRHRLTKLFRAWHTLMLDLRWDVKAIQTAFVHRTISLTTAVLRHWWEYVNDLTSSRLSCATNSDGSITTAGSAFDPWVPGCAFAAVFVAEAEEPFRDKTFSITARCEDHDGLFQCLNRSEAHRNLKLIAKALSVWLDATTECITRRARNFGSVSPLLLSTIRKNKTN